MDYVQKIKNKTKVKKVALNKLEMEWVLGKVKYMMALKMLEIKLSLNNKFKDIKINKKYNKIKENKISKIKKIFKCKDNSKVKCTINNNPKKGKISKRANKLKTNKWVR